MLFLHGAPNAGSTWAEVVARLPDFRNLLVDRPGAGLSTPLPQPLDRETAPQFADRFAVDVLDALEIERADVVASSFGGYLALGPLPGTPTGSGGWSSSAAPPSAPGCARPRCSGCWPHRCGT